MAEGLRRRMELEEAAPHMCPTKCQADRLIGAIAGQALEAVKLATAPAEHLETGKMLGWPLVLTVLTIDIGNRRVGRTAPRTVIHRIAPRKPVLVLPRPGSSTGKLVVVGKDLRRRSENRCHHAKS